MPGHPGTNNANPNGNHNGGVMRFGPDGKLYVFMGDQGRRGWLQNLPNGPFVTAPLVDDTFGGPAPDNAHFSGVILRLNDDGSTPADNPFFAAGAAIGGEVGANIQKIFSYGHRNGFGMAFDPYSGYLWETENADDAFSELNRVVAGHERRLDPDRRARSIASSTSSASRSTSSAERCSRCAIPPTRLADSPGGARERMFMLPGAKYVDPEFSWQYEFGPAGTTFVRATRSARSTTARCGSGRRAASASRRHRRQPVPPAAHARPPEGRRRRSAAGRPRRRQSDEVRTHGERDADRSAGLRDHAVIEQGPDGNLYVVSITDGAIYRISRK